MGSSNTKAASSSNGSLSSPRFALLLLRRAKAQYGSELDFQKIFTCPCLVTNYSTNEIVYANDLFCRMTGHSRKSVIGENTSMLHGEYTDRNIVYQLKEDIQKGKLVESVAIINYTKKGAPFLAIMTLYPLCNPITYKIEHYVAIYTNPTTLTAVAASSIRPRHSLQPSAVYASLDDDSEFDESYKFNSSSSPARLRSESDASLTPSDFSDLVKELQAIREEKEKEEN